eukprot:12140684-Karenia_brevis.AAC.1
MLYGEDMCPLACASKAQVAVVHSEHRFVVHNKSNHQGVQSISCTSAAAVPITQLASASAVAVAHNISEAKQNQQRANSRVQRLMSANR